MATKNLVGNPNGILDNEVNTQVSKSGFGQGISPSHFFTMNEGEIKLQYDELLEPNSEIKISNQFLIWQSPLVSRNLTNQRVRTHYIAQSIKNMWADYRSYMFGGRYGDFVTPELHFVSDSDKLISHYNVFNSKTFAYTIQYKNRGLGGYGDPQNFIFEDKYFDEALKNAFWTYFSTGSLGEALGFQTGIAFTELNTPNPWPFMAYLNFYKWYVANKFILRGDTNFKKVWFPDNEDDFKFHTGTGNRSTGRIGRFFSPEARSGIAFNQLKLNIMVYTHHAVEGVPWDIDKVEFSIQYSADSLSSSTTSFSETFTVDTTEFNEMFKNAFGIQSAPVSIQSLTQSQCISLINFAKNAILEKGFYGSVIHTRTFALDLFETRYMNFNKDYFTGGLISPLINGDYPQIISSGDVTALTAETVLSGGSVSSSIDSSSAVAENGITDIDTFYSLHYMNEDGSNQYFLTGANENETSDKTRIVNALDKIVVNSTLTNPTATTTITGSGSFSTGFSIPDLRLLSATTEYLEALARSDGDYRNMVLAIYGVKPTEISEAPIYIGGSSGYIQTENIFQTSPTEGQPLGTASQTGYAGGSNYIGSYFAKDTTVILGFISVVPEIFYYQGVPKKWVMRHKEEHQNPKFNGLSMQAIENRELFVSGNDSVDTLPFAYAPAWEFMRHRQNRLSGLLKPHFDPETGILLDKPFTQMVQSRGFSDTPDFNGDFISTKDNISTEHLYTQDTLVCPEFTVAIKNNITEILPITRSGIPAKI